MSVGSVATTKVRHKRKVIALAERVVEAFDRVDGWQEHIALAEWLRRQGDLKRAVLDLSRALGAMEIEVGQGAYREYVGEGRRER